MGHAGGMQIKSELTDCAVLVLVDVQRVSPPGLGHRDNPTPRNIGRLVTA